MTEPGGESREGDTVAISSAADTNSNFKQPGQPRPSGRPPSPADDSIIEISPSEPEPSIMEVERLDSVSNEEGLARIISDYEKYKEQQLSNLTFPVGMKGESNI